jgi:hypothetical protein
VIRFNGVMATLSVARSDQAFAAGLSVLRLAIGPLQHRRPHGDAGRLVHLERQGDGRQGEHERDGHGEHDGEHRRALPPVPWWVVRSPATPPATRTSTPSTRI